MRLKSYARRIRRIAYLPYVRHKEMIVPQDQQALQVLLSYHELEDHPVFPNLRQVEFVNAKHAINCLGIFLLTKSISLSLYWSDFDGRLSYAFGKIFRIIKERALNMEQLDLGSFQAGSAENVIQEAQYLSNLVCKMAELRGLATGPHPLKIDALRHLASLPRLQKLQAPNTSKDILESIQVLHDDDVVFPELQRLTLHETDLPSFTQLIIRLKPLQLRELTLFIQTVQTATDIHATFSALQKWTQHNNLRHLVLKPIGGPNRWRWSRESTGQIIIDGSILEPLLSFRNLAVVELNLPCAFELGDGEIKAMAEAWPRLRHLQLGALSGWHIPSSVTCMGLLTLVRNCRELEYLALSLNGSGDSVPPRASLTSADVNTKITYLYVGNGEIKSVDIKRVSQFLLYIFPRLCGIGGKWLYDRSTDLDKWENVVGCLKGVDNAA